MNSKAIRILLWLVVLAGGLLLRVIDLHARPMHTDESVHAYKFESLLDEGYYRYDPHEYHGPVLNYATLISALLRGERTSAQIDEATLRLVPAVFGTLLILTPLFFARALGRRAALFIAVLVAFSPAFVYYSRYYIQEMLLVFFTACFLGLIGQYLQRHRIGWIAAAGACLGLMHASKETFVFAVAAAAVAGLIVLWRCKLRLSFRFSHLLAAAACYVAVSLAFFTSFGANPQGIIDAFTTYGIWMQRAGGQSVHIHPWYYYLDLLTWMEFFEPLTWNEDGIVALALIGVVYLLAKKRPEHSLASFWGFYTLLLTAAYCVIPYKTPWSMLSFVFGMAMVAGWIADRLLQFARYKVSVFILAAAMLLYSVFSPLVQSYLLAFRYASDPVNPYVYAHTGTDIFRMVEQVKTAAYASGQGTDVPIQVIADGDDYWPLPWYLRQFSGVGYWNHINPSAADAPIILAQERIEQPLLQMLYTAPPPGQRHLYLPLLESAVNLRPGIQWQGYVRKDLWDKMQTLPTCTTHFNEVELMDLHSDSQAIKNLHKFSHPAMNTTFGIFMQHPDATYAAAAARAAFSEVDRLEAMLSRFVENSDISRINSTPAGQTVVVDEDTMQCLIAARQAFEQTNGLFNINFAQTAEAALQLNPDLLQVTVNGPVRLDLGGIGKGYAADKMVQVLEEWSITSALVYAGASSVAAMQPPSEKAGWPVTFSDPVTARVRLELMLANEVLSCSGTAKGGHIVNPADGKPVQDKTACWIRLPGSAALADALITAVMIMPLEHIRPLQEGLDGCSILLQTVQPGQTEWHSFGERFQAVP